MNSLTDTIVACSTSRAVSAIGIVRLSGGQSLEVISSLVDSSCSFLPRQMTFALIQISPEINDETMVCYFPSPHSYTGEDMVEVYLHGNPLIVQTFIDLCILKGCRLAEKGEFTRRSFLNGKKDLLQAESVLAMIEAPSLSALKLSSQQLSGKITEMINNLRGEVYNLLVYIEAELDFVEQEIDFLSVDSYQSTLQKIQLFYNQLFSHFHQMSILYHQPSFTLCGLPNAGKSSLFNAFMDQDLAIVTSVEGTTRDVLSSNLLIEGQKVTLNDTAGIRVSSNMIEQEGVKRAFKTIKGSDVILYVLDSLAILNSDVYLHKVKENIEEIRTILDEGVQLCFLFNKIDQVNFQKIKTLSEDFLSSSSCFYISSFNPESLVALKSYLSTFIVNQDRVVDRSDIWSLQRSCLVGMKEELDILLQCDIFLEKEVLPVHLRSLLKKVDRFCHRDFKDDVLTEIFSRFCIGK